MRIIMIFAPTYYELPKAIVKELHKLSADVEVIALATTRHVYDRFLNDKEIIDKEYLVSDCIEDRMKEWIAADYNPELLEKYEQILGTDIINNILIADRQVGQGFVTCADPVETSLTLSIKDHNKKRAYITGCLDYFMNLVDAHKVDAALFYAIADANMAALAEILKLKGKKTLRINHSRVDDLHLLDTDLYGLLGPVYERVNNGETPSEQHRNNAQQWLDNYRSKDASQPDYMLSWQTNLNKSLKPFGIMKGFVHAVLRLTLYRFIKGEKPLTTETGLQRVKDSLSIPKKYYSFCYNTPFMTADEIGQRPFIYYPLHVDPESSTMHLAPQHTNQFAVIEAYAKQKPMHMDLIIKEHPNMIGNRPAGFYKKLLALPGVYMVDPRYPSTELIKKSSLVATITGTVTWEAVLLGKPVISNGVSPYTKANVLSLGIVYEPDMTKLCKAIETASRMEPVPDENITTFLGCLFEESFPMSSSLLWLSYGANDIRKNHSAITKIAEHLLNRLNG